MFRNGPVYLNATGIQDDEFRKEPVYLNVTGVQMCSGKTLCILMSLESRSVQERFCVYECPRGQAVVRIDPEYHYLNAAGVMSRK